MKRIGCLVSVLILAAAIAGCSGGGGDGSSSGSPGLTNVNIRIGSGQPASSPSEENRAAPQAIPPYIESIRFDISGPGMSPMGKVVPIAGQTSITETFFVPDGPDRVFRIGSLDSVGREWHSASRTVDLEGAPVSLDMMMAPVSPPPTCTDADLDGYAMEGGGCGPADCNDNDNTVHQIALFYRDADGDGYGNLNDPQQACGPPAGYVADNRDCDDTDPAVHPGQTEAGFCTDSKDNDCDGNVDGADPDCAGPVCEDNDGDGYFVGTGNCGPIDCNDTNPAIHPGATEICNGADDNCNTAIDEGVKLTFYQDADGDGYGNQNNPAQACSAPAGYVADNTDCDDTNPNIHPGATEVGYCEDSKDNDCDGLVDNADPDCPVDYCQDKDNDGYFVGIGECGPIDCNDTNPAIYPGATEVCDGTDDNCNGAIDEGVKLTFYQDGDGDGYGNPSNSLQACTPPAGYVADNTDCDDANPNVHPGATEVGYCEDSKDNDCDGQVDCSDSDCQPLPVCQPCVDNDKDTYSVGGGECGPIDCNDNNPAIHPGATEVCNSIDDNCNGSIDEEACPQTLVVTSNYTWSMLSSSPQGIYCGHAVGSDGYDCSASFPYGTYVNLYASVTDPSPYRCYMFDHWEGDPDCSDGTVVMWKTRFCDAIFRLISTASITVTLPNGGEELYNTGLAITWTSEGLPIGESESISIWLYKGGTVERQLTTGTNNDGEFIWNPSYYEYPDVGDDYRVRIQYNKDPCISDMSDSNFSFIFEPGV